MAGIIPVDDIRRLQRRMGRLMEDLGLSDFESEMNRLQQRLGGVMEEYAPGETGPGTMMPLADVRETDDAVIVTMDLPGVNKQDVDISVTDDQLRVVAEAGKETETGAPEGSYHKRERTFTRFERVVTLPVAVKGDQATARLENGVLTVTLPKEVVTSRKRINIE